MSKTKKQVFNKKIYRVKINDNKSGKKLVMMRFSKAKLTKKEIQNEVDKLSTEFQQKGQHGQIMASLYFGKGAPLPQGYGNSTWFEFGQKVKLFSVLDYELDTPWEEPEYFSAFDVYFRNHM